MADALIKYETIEERQIREVLAGKVPSAPEGWEEVEFEVDIKKEEETNFIDKNMDIKSSNDSKVNQARSKPETNANIIAEGE